MAELRNDAQPQPSPTPPPALDMVDATGKAMTKPDDKSNLSTGNRIRMAWGKAMPMASLFKETGTKPKWNAVLGGGGGGSHARHDDLQPPAPQPQGNGGNLPRLLDDSLLSKESSGLASPTLRGPGPELTTNSSLLLLPVKLEDGKPTEGEWRAVGSEAIAIGQGRTRRPRAMSLVDPRPHPIQREEEMPIEIADDQVNSLSNSLPHRASFDWGRQAFSPFAEDIVMSRMSSQSDLDRVALADEPRVAVPRSQGDGEGDLPLTSSSSSSFNEAAPSEDLPSSPQLSIDSLLDSGSSSTPQLPIMLHAELGFADEAEATELFKRSSLDALIDDDRTVQQPALDFIHTLRRPSKSMAQTPGPDHQQQPRGDVASLLESLDLGTLRSPALLFSPFPAAADAEAAVTAEDLATLEGAGGGGGKIRRHSAAAPAWLSPQQLRGNSLWSKEEDPEEEDSAASLAYSSSTSTLYQQHAPPYRRNGPRRHSMAEMMPPLSPVIMPAGALPNTGRVLPRPPPNFYSPVIPDDEIDELNDDYGGDLDYAPHHYGPGGSATPYLSYTPAMADHAVFQMSTYQGPVFAVEFKAGRAELFYVAEREGGRPQFSVRVGDLVIVEADRGEDLGKITAEISMARLKQLMAANDKAEELAKIMRPDSAEEGERNLGKISPELAMLLSSKEIVPKRIHRLAQQADLKLLQAKAQEEALAMVRCQSRVRQKKLPMEVVDAEYQWDRNKLTFYFCADRRIDFRELVRDLFRIYKTRIWMCAVDKNSPRMQAYLRDSPSLTAILSSSSSMSTPYGRPC